LARFSLYAPGEWFAGREIAIPVVEGAEHAAGVLGKPRAGAERDGAHRRNHAEVSIGIGAVAIDIVEELAGDERERLVPGRLAPLAFAPFPGPDQGGTQALRSVNVFREASTLLAPAGIVVGQIGRDARIVRRLLLPNH